MPASDSRSVEELVSGALDTALLADDGATRWTYVTALQRRGDRTTWEAMCGLCSSSSAEQRILGIDVLGQLGFEEGKPFREETVPILLPACREADEKIVDAAVTALGHLGGAQGLPAILDLVAHPSTVVRLAVARALPNLVDDDPPDTVVAALTTLTTDADAEVRDWATFGLGVLLEVDSPAVRDTLLARITDEGGDTAGEALLGLATRCDERALAPILERLRDDPGNLIVEAAGELGHWGALPLLLHLKASNWELNEVRPHVLDDAIESCLFERR